MGGFTKRNRNRTWLAVLGLIPASVGFAWGLSSLHPDSKWQKTPSKNERIAISDKVTLPDSIARLRDGRPLWIHFYGADCACSLRRLSQTMAYERRYGDDFQVIAVFVGSSKTTIEDRPKGLTWRTPVIPDPKSGIAHALGVVSTPQAVMLGTDSELLYRGNYGGIDGIHEATAQFDLAMKAILVGKLPPQGLEGLGCSVDRGATR